MQAADKDKNPLAPPDQLLNSLVRELKNPLILIARSAELEKSATPSADALGSIQSMAEKTLKLIDNYLLMAQAEYGQRTLPLEPVGIGSIVYEVTKDLMPYARDHQIDLSAEVKDGNVMANRQGLRTVVLCLSELVMGQNHDKEDVQKRVFIRTRKQDEKVSVSVVGSTMRITNRDIEQARRLQGSSHLAGGNMSDSGIRLAIADVLTNSLGSSLHTKQINGLHGLSFELPGSKQLKLV